MEGGGEGLQIDKSTLLVLIYKEFSRRMKTIIPTLPQSLIQILMRSDNITMENKTTITYIFPH